MIVETATANARVSLSEWLMGKAQHPQASSICHL